MMLPHFIFFCWCLNFTKEEQICWTMEDIQSHRNWSMRCPEEGSLLVKDIAINSEKGEIDQRWCFNNNWWNDLKCNGLQDICDTISTEIIAGIEEYVENCYFRYKLVNACIIYDCITENFNSIVERHSSALTATKGRYLFRALQFTGFLRCSVYGNISNVTISKSTEFLVRNKNGTRILEYEKVEITQERPDESSISIVHTPGKCIWFNVKRLRWITTFVSISLTVLLVGSCVINCILWKAFKARNCTS